MFKFILEFLCYTGHNNTLRNCIEKATTTEPQPVARQPNRMAKQKLNTLSANDEENEIMSSVSGRELVNYYLFSVLRTIQAQFKRCLFSYMHVGTICNEP